MHVVNTLEEGRAALLAWRESHAAGSLAPGGCSQPALPTEPILHLCTPPFAACYAGVNYYRHLVDALAAEFPDIRFRFTLDCGDDPAIAFEARRMGFTELILRPESS